MNITRENDKLVLRIPLKQNMYNPYMGDDSVGMCDNLVGIIAGSKYSLSQLIDMDYKDKGPQEGSPYIMFDTEEGLLETCKMFDIQVWRHSVCTFPKCGKVLRGVMTMGDNGVECCEHEKGG